MLPMFLSLGGVPPAYLSSKCGSNSHQLPQGWSSSWKEYLFFQGICCQMSWALKDAQKVHQETLCYRPAAHLPWTKQWMRWNRIFLDLFNDQFLLLLYQQAPATAPCADCDHISNGKIYQDRRSQRDLCATSGWEKNFHGEVSPLKCWHFQDRFNDLGRNEKNI